MLGRGTRAWRHLGLAIRSAWGFTIALLVVVLGSVLLVAELHDREDQHRQARIVASELQQDASELHVAIDALRADEAALDEMAVEIDDELRDLQSSVTSLEQLRADAIAPDIERDLMALQSALESELTGFEAGSSGSSRGVQAEETTSAFDAFDARVDAANDHYEAAAIRSSEVSDIGLRVAMLIAGLAVAGLSFRHERGRRRSQRDLEERLRQRVTEVAEITEKHRQLEAMKYTFVSAVSHELRTPLTAIQMALEMLDECYVGELPESALQSVAVAARGSRRLARLIEDVIDLERLESGRLTFHPGPHDLHALLLETAESLSPLTERAELEVVIRKTHANALCDGDRILQVLFNLVGNAIKFTAPGGSIHLETVCRDDEVEVIVRDNGRGIPAAQLDAVFDRFHQVNSTADQRLGGAGLGLDISRHIVESHGGRIWVDSEYGVGTAVHFTLPTTSTPHVSSLANDGAALVA